MEKEAIIKPKIVKQKACARIPTVEGEFRLCLYQTNFDDKEHLALVMGDVKGKENVLVRVHSECFTGDVLGSQRCDCGEQLHTAMQIIARAGEGVVLYLRQEGRGIGLAKKLKAYNLQDRGYDTVEANLVLGHQADERDYSVAALILRDLGVRSVKLLTNNPEKIESLNGLGIPVTERLPLLATVTPENINYLRTKVKRMKHLLNLSDLYLSKESSAHFSSPLATVEDRLLHAKEFRKLHHRPFVTVSYAQSIDGSIASRNRKQMQISGQQSMVLTHRLRAAHDAILIGIETVLVDNPRLTVRLVEGRNPHPIILDSSLRMPLDSYLMQRTDLKPWIATGKGDRQRARALEEAGAQIIYCDILDNGKLDLHDLMHKLADQNINSIMVEGGAQVISSFIESKLVDQFVVTMAPQFVGGLKAVDVIELSPASCLRLEKITYQQLGEDLIIWAEPIWERE